MQQVYFSRTLSGQAGLFTKGVLACPLTEQEAASAAEVEAIAKRMQFQLVDRKPVEQRQMVADQNMAPLPWPPVS